MTVDAYTPLVERIATRLHARIGGELDFDDVMQLGIVGLLEAADRFEGTRGVRFEVYAQFRIEGAILNGLPSYSEHQRQLAAHRELTKSKTKSRRDAGAEPLTSASKCPDDSLDGLARALVLGVGPLEAEGLCEPDNAHIRVELAQRRQRVAELIKRLPQSERRIIVLHYFQQVPFEDIARSLGLTKGRVSQLHHAGLLRLREHLSNWRCADFMG
jgi:RNA polymerase sigma factor for flagellar operon FliA